VQNLVKKKKNNIGTGASLVLHFKQFFYWFQKVLGLIGIPAAQSQASYY
jgi:hypothetical protein